MDFLSLLKEQKNLSRSCHWTDVKKKIDSDARYKAVDSSTRREDWFRDYIRKLDDTVREREREMRLDPVDLETLFIHFLSLFHNSGE